METSGNINRGIPAALPVSGCWNHIVSSSVLCHPSNICWSLFSPALLSSAPRKGAKPRGLCALLVTALLSRDGTRNLLWPWLSPPGLREFQTLLALDTLKVINIFYPWLMGCMIPESFHPHLCCASIVLSCSWLCSRGWAGAGMLPFMTSHKPITPFTSSIMLCWVKSQFYSILTPGVNVSFLSLLRKELSFILCLL